jgi:uncharacterized protein
VKKFAAALLTASAAFALLAPMSHAQTSPASPVPIEVQDADPALWVVKDADTTIYLFGTVHMLKPGLGWFDEAVREAFDKSEALKIEVVLPEDQNEIMKKTIPLAIDQTGKTISSQLSDSERAAYEKAMESLGLPTPQFEIFEPWFAAITLASVSLLKDGYQPDLGSEKVLTKAAKDAGKAITGLESFEEQMGFFDTLPRDVQLTFLNQSVAQLPTAGAEFADILFAWTKGDADDLGARMNRSMTASPEIADVLLYKRNERWADWIKTRLAEPGSVFMAVGAGHLAGPKSVQEYLTARGLTAERIAY